MDDPITSLTIDPTVHDALEAEAKRLNLSASAVAEHAIRYFLEIQEEQREILKQRIAEADRGDFISSEAMLTWIKSWGTNAELPPPKPDLHFGPRAR